MFPVFHSYVLKEFDMFNHENVIYNLIPDIDYTILGKEVIHKFDVKKIKNENLRKCIQLHNFLDELAESSYFLFRNSKNFKDSYFHNILEIYYDQIIARKNKKLLEDIIKIVNSLSEHETEIISENLNLKDEDVKNYYKKVSAYLFLLNPFKYIVLPKDPEVETFIKYYKRESVNILYKSRISTN